MQGGIITDKIAQTQTIFVVDPEIGEIDDGKIHPFLRQYIAYL